MNSDIIIPLGSYPSMSVGSDGQTFESNIQVGLRPCSKKFVAVLPFFVGENQEVEDFTLQGVIDRCEAACEAYSNTVLGRIAVPAIFTLRTGRKDNFYVQDTPATRAKVKELQDSIVAAAGILAGISTAVNPEQYLLNISSDWQPPADASPKAQADLPTYDTDEL